MFAVATPFITIYLLWQQHKLRLRILKLTDLSVEVSDGLRRDLLELKRQVEASAKAAATVAEAPPAHSAVHSQVDRAAASVASTSLKNRSSMLRLRRSRRRCRRNRIGRLRSPRRRFPQL